MLKSCSILSHQQKEYFAEETALQHHWRATQLADTMDPFTIKEALHRATILLNMYIEPKVAG
jgi:hypothetical protein